MMQLPRRTCLAWCLAAALPAWAQGPAGSRGPESFDRELGKHRFRYWGFEVYEAQLRVTPGFDAQAWDQPPLALSLTYARTFKGADIARRSIDEMARQAPLADPLRQRWQTQLTELFPDVGPGDTLIGVYRPQAALQLWRRQQQTQWLGEVADPELARRFIGIWLAPQTSEPAMRQALLRLP